MTYSIHFNAEEGIIEVTFRGNLDIQTAKAALQEIVDMIAKEQCFQVLSDLREAHMALSLAEIFDFPQQLNNLSDRVNLNARAVRRAIVTHKTDQMSFYENVFSNRGYSAMIFDDPAKAKAWLRKE
ncbi:MAG: hypothetical protein JNK32_04310 [Anaerolineales bacterium]|nr:hypothetical protein [Anaerolineales bacterium]